LGESSEVFVRRTTGLGGRVAGRGVEAGGERVGEAEGVVSRTVEARGGERGVVARVVVGRRAGRGLGERAKVAGKGCGGGRLMMLVLVV
jgi:hypothetical protein